MAEKKLKAKKSPEVMTASVGPIAGVLDAAPDVPAAPVKPAFVPVPSSCADEINELYGRLRSKLVESNIDKKLPRRLRWALKSLDEAHDAAQRYLKHRGH